MTVASRMKYGWSLFAKARALVWKQKKLFGAAFLCIVPILAMIGIFGLFVKMGTLAEFRFWHQIIIYSGRLFSVLGISFAIISAVIVFALHCYTAIAQTALAALVGDAIAGQPLAIWQRFKEQYEKLAYFPWLFWYAIVMFIFFQYSMSVFIFAWPLLVQKRLPLSTLFGRALELFLKFFPEVVGLWLAAVWFWIFPLVIMILPVPFAGYLGLSGPTLRVITISYMVTCVTIYILWTFYLISAVSCGPMVLYLEKVKPEKSE